MADRVSLSGASAFVMAPKKENKKTTISEGINKNTGSGLGYFAGNVGLGFMGIAEGTADFIGGALNQIFGGENGQKTAKYLHANDYTGELTERLNESYNPGKVMKFFGDVGQGIGQSSVFYLNAAAPGLGTGLFFAGAAGRSLTEAYQQTGELGFKEYGYAATEGAVEAALEYLTNGGAPGLDKGKDTLVGGIKKLLGKSAKEGATSAIRNGIVKNVISEASGEFLEEFIESYTGVLNQRLFQIDPNASVSLGEALYSGLVGAASGGLMAGVSSSVRAGYSNYRGNKVISEGKAQNLVDTAKVIQDYVKSNDWSKYANKDDIRGNLNDLIAAYQAYQGLEESQRTGARAAVYLGEMQYNMAVLEAAVGSARIQDDIKEKAEQYVEYVQKAYGEDFTAEDIRDNRDGVLQKLAVHRWAGMFNDSVTVGESHEQWVREQLEKHKRTGTDIPADVTAETAEEERAVTIAGKTKDGIEYSENDTGDVISRVYDVGEGRSAIAVQNDDGTWTVEAGTDDNLLDNESEKIGTKVKAENLDGVILNIRDNFDDIVIQATENRDRRIAEAEKAEKEAEEAKEKKEKKAERERKIRSVFKDSDRTYYASEDDLRFAEIEDEKVIKSKLNFKQMAVAKLLDKWLGKNYRIALFEGDGKGRIGAYKAGTIYIDVNASMLQVTAHELVHSFAVKNKTQYDALAGFIVEKLFKGDQSKMDAAVKEYVDKYKEAGVNLTADEAKEELIAKSCEKVFGSVQGIRDILTYNKGLFKAAFSFFDKAVSIFEEIITAEGEGNKYAEELAADVEAIKKVRDMFAEELRNDAQEETSGKSFDIAENVKDDEIIVLENSKLLDELIANSELPPAKTISNYIFAILGGREINLSDGTKAIVDHGDAKHIGRTPGEIKKAEISNIIRIIESAKFYSHEKVEHNKFESFDYYVSKVKYGQNIYEVFVNVGKSKNDGTRHIYDLTHHSSEKIKRSADRMNGLERLPDISADSIFVENASSTNDYNPIIDKSQVKSTKNNGSFDISETDSEGKTLSDGQREFFRNSKVVDEDGNLRRVYHGTDEDFTVFDRNKGRSTMDIQGMFFSPWELDAQGYGSKVGEYYLNITNPASESEGYKALNRFKGQNDAGVKAREYLISQGYDGVNNGDEEYIAFYPEQVKRTDNVNPTEDRDVRFDISEENGYTAAEQDAAREIVKEYDMFLPEKRRSISEFIRSTKGTKADKATIKAVANIIAAADGLDVRFADSKEKGLIVSEDGKRLIILDKGLESSDAIRRTLSAEIIHMAEDTENYGRFAKMILSGVTEEQKNAVKAKYEKFWKEYGVEATDEEILRECVSEIGADLMTQDDIVKAWENKDRKLAYRILVGARSLARRLFGKNKEAYKQAARLTETLAAAVAEGELRRYTGAPKIQWSLSERRESERNERLKAEVEYLKELVRLQGQITDGKKFTKASLEKVARDIKKQSGSIGKTEDLVGLLNDFYTYCAENTIENGKFDYDAIVAQAQKVVDWIYQNHYSKDQYDDYHQGLIDYLKDKRIYISPKLQAEIASQFGSYKEFRDALMGYVMFTKDGTPLDSWWQELSSLYPALFDSEAVEGDQPGQLYEAIENLKGNPMPDEYFNPEYEESTKMDIFSRVFDGYWNLTKMTTVADKYAAKISELEAKHKEEIQKLKESNAEKVKEARKKAAEELKKEAREIHYFTRGKAKKTLKQIVDEYVGKYVTDPDELKGAERDFSRDLVEIPEGAKITVRGLDSVVEKLYQGMYAADNKTAITAASKEIAADLMNRLTIKGDKEISVKEMLDSRNVALATEAEGQIRDRITAILNGEEVLSEAGKVRQRYENLLKRYREETLKRTDELRAEIEAAKGTKKATLQAIEQISRAKRQYKDGNYKYRGILSAPVMQVLSDFVIKAKTRGGFLDPAGVRRAMAAYTDMLAVTDVSADLAEEYEALGLDPNVARDLGDTVREVLKGMDFNNEEMMKSELSDAEIETFADVARAVAQLYRTYNKYYDEKRKEWVDADETAKKAISNVETTVRLHEGDKKVVKAFRELMDKYGIEGLDPLAVAKLMDGYAPDGVMTDIMRDIINAENAKTYRIQQYMKEVDDFISSTKGFEKHLTSEEDMVEYKGVKLTRDEFIQLYMTTFRKQALLHLGLGRMEFGSVNDKNGIRIIAPAIESRRFEDTDLAKKEAPSLEDLQNDCERVVTDIRKLADSVLTEEDKKYIALMEKFYNEVSTKDKSETDFKYFGMTNVVEDPTDRYVPIVTSSSSRASSITDERSSMLEFSTLSGQSFNKNTIKGAKNPLSFTGAYQLMQKHANGLAAYVELYAPMQKLDRVWSADINHDKQNSNRLRDIISRTYGDNCEKYIRSLMGDIQGINKKKPNAFNSVIAKLRSNYAIFQLGANPKTWFNQLGSMGALYRFCDMDSIAKGLTSPNKDVMGKYSTAAAIREDSDVAVQAQALTKQVKGKITDLLMKPIGYSDMLIVGMSWGACQYQVQKEKGFAVGSEENLKAAGELLDRVINESQDTSMASTKTGIARADNDLIKGLAMFRSAPFKQTSRLVDAFGTIDRIRAEKKAGMEVSEERVKEANKELGRTLSGWALQAAIGVAVGALFSWLYKKDDDKDAKDYAIDFSSELISVIPILGDAYGYFASGYDLSYFAFDMANDALKATKNTATLIGDGVTGKKVSRQDVAKLVYDDSQVLGQFTGIPIRNVKNFFTGITKRVSSIFGGSLGYSLDGVLYKPSYASDLSKAIEDGNDKLANTIISMMYSDKKATAELSDAVAKEIIRLYGEGHTSILPPTVGDTITVDGVSYDVKAKDQKKIRSIANKADAEIVQMMQGAIYQGMDDNARAKAVEKLYKLYYDRAVNDTFGVPMSKIDALARLGDAKEIFAAAGNIAGIANDVDQNGKAVSGSRKLKVETYLSGLNVSEDTKNLIRYAAGYSGEDLKKEIRKIVEKSAADDKEMEEIYEALGLE